MSTPRNQAGQYQETFRTKWTRRIATLALFILYTSGGASYLYISQQIMQALEPRTITIQLAQEAEAATKVAIPDQIEWQAGTFTAYSSSVDETDDDPYTTASGQEVRSDGIACPGSYAFGTKIEIETLGIFECIDRGSKIEGNHFDLWKPSKASALKFGRQSHNFRIL